jgi:hypothetical protein
MALSAALPRRWPSSPGREARWDAAVVKRRGDDRTDDELIPLTVNEIRRLHAIFKRPAYPPEYHERRSGWRRRNQLRARHSHYQRRRINEY